MAIGLLKAGAKGDPTNSTGKDVADTVNSLIYPSKKAASNVPVSFFAPSNNFNYTVVGGSPVVEYSQAPNGKTGLKISASAFCAIAITEFAGMRYNGDMFVSLYGSQSQTNLGTVEMLAIFGPPAANLRRGRRTILESSPQQNNAREQGGALTYHFNGGNTTTVGTIPTPTNFEMSQLRIQLNPASAGAFEVWIFGAGMGVPRKKGRVCVMYDDGYTSSWRLGFPVWKAIGVPQTMAVIASEVGKDSTYMDLVELKLWNGAGGSCVAHGPIGGTGSLVSRYGSLPDWPQNAVNDIRHNIQYLRDNGLAQAFDDKCYIFPQGEFQRTPNDTSLLDAIIADGTVNAARSATIMPLSQRQYIYNQDTDSKYQRLAMPRIGHRWAGTTATEANNISNLVTMIQECALYGLDFFLVFHQVKPTSTADGAMGDIDIRVSDMQLLANAVKTEIDAGRLEAVHMRDFVATDTVYGSY